MVQDRHHDAHLPPPPVTPKAVPCAFVPESPSAAPNYFRSLIDLAQEGIILLDAEGRISFINKWLADKLGFQPERLCGQPIFDYLEDDGDSILAAQLEQCRQGQPEAAVLRLRWRNGTSRAVLVSVVAREESGAFQGYLAAVTDITRLKGAGNRTAVRQGIPGHHFKQHYRQRHRHRPRHLQGGPGQRLIFATHRP